MAVQTDMPGAGIWRKGLNQRSAVLESRRVILARFSRLGSLERSDRPTVAAGQQWQLSWGVFHPEPFRN
jgi:hypothetical protein